MSVIYRLEGCLLFLLTKNLIPNKEKGIKEGKE